MQKKVDIAVLRPLLAEGLSDTEIAARLHVSRNCICKLRNDNGLPCNRKRKRADTEADIALCLRCKRKTCNGNIEACRCV